MKHLLSLADLAQTDFEELLERSCRFVQAPPTQRRLVGRSVGIEFRKTSTRTRTSFAVAAVRLGAHPMVYGPADLQTNTGESIEDTTRVLGGYLDALVIRTAAGQSEMARMAKIDRLPIINAMSAEEHPTQALSDFAMIKREFGTLKELTVVYCGEGNNTAAALALGASRIPGMSLQLHLPPGFGLSAQVMRSVDELSSRYGGKVRVLDRPFEARSAVAPVNVVYTTRWQTTGTSKSDELWREKFAPFRVTVAMMEQLTKRSTPVFMHDLPAARGEECDSAVLDGPGSIAFEQARQKLFTAMAVIDWCVES
jgi:ornithine carbamoyltransferase